MLEYLVDGGIACIGMLCLSSLMEIVWVADRLTHQFFLHTINKGATDRLTVCKYTDLSVCRFCVGTQGCSGTRDCLIDAVGYLAGGSATPGIWTCPVSFPCVSTSHAARQWCHSAAAFTAHCRLLLAHAWHCPAAVQGNAVA